MNDFDKKIGRAATLIVIGVTSLSIGLGFLFGAEWGFLLFGAFWIFVGIVSLSAVWKEYEG